MDTIEICVPQQKKAELQRSTGGPGWNWMTRGLTYKLNDKNFCWKKSKPVSKFSHDIKCHLSVHDLSIMYTVHFLSLRNIYLVLQLPLMHWWNGTFQNAVNPGVTHILLYWVVLQIAVAPKHLHSIIANLETYLTLPKLHVHTHWHTCTYKHVTLHRYAETKLLRQHLSVIIIIIIIITITFKGAIWVSSLRRESSPTCARKCSGRNRVQITCNTSSPYHVQHVVLRATISEGRRHSDWQQKTEFHSHNHAKFQGNWLANI